MQAIVEFARGTPYGEGAVISQEETQEAIGQLHVTYTVAYDCAIQAGYPYKGSDVTYSFVGTDGKKYEFRWKFTASRCTSSDHWTFCVVGTIECDGIWHTGYHTFIGEHFQKLPFSGIEFVNPPTVRPDIRRMSVRMPIYATSGDASATSFCKKCINKMWNFDIVPNSECLICMEPRSVYCLHCRNGRACGKTHHLVHKSCGTKYLMNDCRCPVCKYAISAD